MTQQNIFSSFFLHLWASISSTEFYRQLLAEHKETGIRHLFFCCLFSVLIACAALILKITIWLNAFEAFPTLEYEKTILKPQKQEIIYDNNNAPFALIDTQNVIENISLSHPVTFIFSKDLLLLKKPLQYHGKLSSYIKVNYSDIFTDNQKFVDGKFLQKRMLALAIALTFSSPLVDILSLIALLTTISVIFFATVFMLIKISNFVMGDGFLCEFNQITQFKLVVFLFGPAILFFPAFAIFNTIFSLIFCIILILITTSKLGPILYEINGKN